MAVNSVVLLLTKCSLIGRGEEWRNGFCVCVCLRLLSSFTIHCVIGFALSLSPCLLPAVPPACQCNTDRSASCGPLQPHPNHFWQRSQLLSFPTLKFLYTFHLGTALSLPTSGTRLSSLFRPAFENKRSKPPECYVYQKVKLHSVVRSRGCDLYL